MVVYSLSCKDVRQRYRKGTTKSRNFGTGPYIGLVPQTGEKMGMTAIKNEYPTIGLGGVNKQAMGRKIIKVDSPNGGATSARQQLNDRFAGRISVNPAYSRKLVSYQGNKSVPGFRWFKYKEGFSRELVLRLIDEYQPQSVLDPFAGFGTTPIVAAGGGGRGTGVEIMPVGTLAGSSISSVANGLEIDKMDRVFGRLLDRVESTKHAGEEFYFPHVRITEKAFPAATEHDIAKAREFVARERSPDMQSLLNFACMSILEVASYTRKDGQYLRWDYRSGRTRAKKKLNKGEIPPYRDMLRARLAEIVSDADILKEWYGGGEPRLITGSSLELLRGFSDSEFDLVITSPPYANRYDYTRTYALELAWLGFDQEAFSKLRQGMLSATVENKAKLSWLEQLYGKDNTVLRRAKRAYSTQHALHEVLEILVKHTHELGNKNVIRLIQGYFLEMAVVVAELGRVVRRGGTVIMVNDNVQYHGEEVPVDFILSAFAEQSGFRCADIWTLARGKGNASQQMARFGRREIRKCIYRWVRSNG